MWPGKVSEGTARVPSAGPTHLALGLGPPEPGGTRFLAQAGPRSLERPWQLQPTKTWQEAQHREPTGARIQLRARAEGGTAARAGAPVTQGTGGTGWRGCGRTFPSPAIHRRGGCLAAMWAQQGTEQLLAPCFTS